MPSRAIGSGYVRYRTDTAINVAQTRLVAGRMSSSQGVRGGRLCYGKARSRAIPAASRGGGADFLSGYRTSRAGRSNPPRARPEQRGARAYELDTDLRVGGSRRRPASSNAWRVPSIDVQRRSDRADASGRNSASLVDRASPRLDRRGNGAADGEGPIHRPLESG